MCRGDSDGEFKADRVKIMPWVISILPAPLFSFSDTHQGQAVLDIKISSSPGRDRKNAEEKYVSKLLNGTFKCAIFPSIFHGSWVFLW